MADLDRIEREMIWRRAQLPRYAIDDRWEWAIVARPTPGVSHAPADWTEE